MKKANTLLIGLGYHARRIYAKYLNESELVNFSCFFDLENQRGVIEKYLSENNIVVNGYYTDNYELSDKLSKKDEEALNKIVRKHDINAVVISTEPLAHLKYVNWALDNNLHILLDKPISTEVDVSTSFDRAQKLFDDYKKIEKVYRQKPQLVFTLQAQRRYHDGYMYTRKQIDKIARLTNCPLTSVQSFHSDGQWRFPDEIINQNYHPYNQGYGKMSHSGYHSLDIAIWFATASLRKNKSWNNYTLYSQFVRPIDFTTQLTPEDYTNLFPDIDLKKLVDSNKMSDANVKGEIDAFTNIALKHDNHVITSMVCSAVHNGFGQRNWTSVVGRDLYKGNGRIRQESYTLEQGPFQSIIINSYQSQDLMAKDADNYSVGGEYHFDIHIFRNNKLFPQFKAYELVKINDLRPVRDLGYSRGHQEEARRSCIDEFFDAIRNKRSIDEQESNFLQHRLSTQILSSIYKSASLSFNGGSGIINERI